MGNEFNSRQNVGRLLVAVGLILIATQSVRAGVGDPFYPSYSEVLTQLQDLATNNPSIVSYEIIGNETHGGRDVVAVKISDNVNSEEDEPAWVFNGFVHGSEQMGLRILLDLADDLANGYGSDPDVTDWVDAYEIWIVILLNPWGFDHNSSGGNSDTGTRKNFENTGDMNTSGVDLGRNYDFRWDQGGESDPDDSRFRGPEAFSELETQAIRDLVVEHRPIFGVTFHQGNDPDGGQIMRPWSGSGSNVPPDSERLSDIAELFADWVFASRSRANGPFCTNPPTLEDPDGDGPCTNEGDEEYCNELCWEPTQSTMGRYGQPSNWYYHEVGMFDYTVEISDHSFNGDFMHDANGPQTTDEQTKKDIATEFALNNREAIKSWFAYFLQNSSEPYVFTGPGITGHITDALLGIPLSATVEVSGFTSSLIEDRISDAQFGRYWRLLPVGNHNVTVTKPGYEPWNGMVNVNNGALTVQDVQLTPKLEIILPDSTNLAWVGEPTNTRSFTVRLLLGSPGEPCIGPLPFSVFVKDETDTWIEANAGVQACVQDSYWISVQAPDDGDGSFVADGIYDLRVELDTVSGESPASVRYTDRDEDTIIVMDISGSMGNGGKLEAAQEAATLLVNELTDDDQGALVWFTGDGVEPNNDAFLEYPLDTMGVGNQVALIGDIAGLTPDSQTSIGDGIDEALDESEGPRADPDHFCGIVLLSDGIENEDDLWADVQPRAAGSPCVIHVVALGPETDEVLLQDISKKGTADENDDGSYHFATITDPSPFGPTASVWQNRLAGQFDDIATRLDQRQRLFKVLDQNISAPDDHYILVDDSVDEAVFALKWTGISDVTLELRQPDNTLVLATTAGVTFRSSSTDEVYRVQAPMPGLWHARVLPAVGQSGVVPYILTSSGETFIEFRLFTSADVAPVKQGEKVHILATLTSQAQPIIDADVRVTIDAPDGSQNMLKLFDDGLHEDGSADDGFYANTYNKTILGDEINPQLPDGQGLQSVGSYNVGGNG